LIPEDIKQQIKEQNAKNNSITANTSYFPENDEKYWNEIDYDALFA